MKPAEKVYPPYRQELSSSYERTSLPTTSESSVRSNSWSIRPR